MKQGSSASNAENISASITRRIRVRTADSAFVYAIFEASAGVCAYSTLPHRPGDRHRDLELVIPLGQVPEADRILADLTAQLSGEVYDISDAAHDPETGSD
jgi:hypothetical protein